MPIQERTVEKLNKLLELLRDDTISTTQVGQFLNLVLGVIKQAKQNFEEISAENRQKITEALNYIEKEHSSLLKDFKKELKSAYNFLLEVQRIKSTPGKDGQDGRMPVLGVDYFVPDEARIIETVLGMMPNPKDGSPDTPEEVRDKLETLEGKNRLDASAIKNLPEATKKIITEVGGVRYLEQLADVSIPITSKRKNLLVQYDTTDNRWESGVALTVGTTQPTAPVTNDIWIDIS